MSNVKILNDVAEALISALLDRGFTIQRYDACSTNSIYLKLDYGVSNSVRISDHRGKEKLNYRYNIGADQRAYRKEEGRFVRYYFPVSQLEKLVDLIEEERIGKIRRYGTKAYFRYMEKNKEEGRSLPGFWQKARLIERSRTCS